VIDLAKNWRSHQMQPVERSTKSLDRYGLFPCNREDQLSAEPSSWGNTARNILRAFVCALAFYSKIFVTIDVVEMVVRSHSNVLCRLPFTTQSRNPVS